MAMGSFLYNGLLPPSGHNNNSQNAYMRSSIMQVQFPVNLDFKAPGNQAF